MSFLKKLGSSARKLFGTRTNVFKKQGASKRQEDDEGFGDVPVAIDEMVGDAEWHDLTSSNVRRIRWGSSDQILQVQFHSGDIYEFLDVELEVYRGYLTTHSPGQYHWHTIRGMGYSYAKLGAGEATTPAPARFDGKPFMVPKEVADVQAKAGRKQIEGYDEGGALWNKGEPVAKGVGNNLKVPGP